MTDSNGMTAAQLHARLGHPVVDADGHWLEFGPYVREQMRRIGGDTALEGYTLYSSHVERTLTLTSGERRRLGITPPPWWGLPAKNTLDRATGMMPALLRSRMDELGLDFTVLYPTAGLLMLRNLDARTRRAAIRAYNIFCAEYFGRYSDRMTPVAVIPMHTPEEAVEELEFTTRQLGLKAVLLGSMVQRRKDVSAPAGDSAVWLDLIGSDFIRAELRRWADVVKSANIQLN